MQNRIVILILTAVLTEALISSCHKTDELTYTAPPPRTTALESDSALAGAGRPIWRYPSDTITVAFEVTGEDSCRVKIDLFNSGRQLVFSLVDSLYAPGDYSHTWSARNEDSSHIPYGIYYYQIEICGQLSTRKITYRREKY